MITKLRLVNWKSHMDTELEFSPGVNCLVGLMGSGKTSVLEGISFALFGTFPNIQSKRVGLGDLIMRRPQAKKTAEVSLEFTANGKAYSVYRKIERGRGTVEASVREDGRLLDVGTKGVSSVIESALKMDYDLFSKAVYSEQNMLDFFLRIPRGQRMDTIDRMLKLDVYEKVRERAVSLYNRIGQGIEEKVRIAADMEKETLEDRLRGIRAEISGLENTFASLGKEVEAVSGKRSGLEAQLEEYAKREKEVRGLEIDQERLRSGIAELSERLKEREDQLAGRDMESVEKGIIETEKEIAGCQGSIEEQEALASALREAMGSLNAEARIVQDSVKALGGLGAKCPVCDSPITEQKRQSLVESRMAEDRRIRGLLEANAKEIRNATEELKGLRKRAEEMRVKRDELRSILLSAKDMDSQKERMKDYQKRLAGCSERLEEARKGYESRAVDEARKGLQQAISRESEIRTRRESIEDVLRDKSQMLSELEKRQALLERYQKEIETDRTAADMLKSFEAALKVSQAQLREEFLGIVNAVLASVWGELYPYQDYREVRLSVDRDYVLEVRESSGEWVSVEGMVSGGERSMACLALRIAFSLAFIPNLKWLMLDEPTHNLDVNAVGHLVSAFNEKMQLFSEQVFIITHDERISEGLNGTLYRFERNKGIDEPTRVVKL